MIKLKKISNEYLEELNSFELPEEQAQFTALPSKILEKREGENRIVILEENEPVGFFLIHKNERPLAKFNLN